MNPYASHLGDHDPLPVITATPGRLRELFQKVGPDRANRAPAPGKWCVREILAHLADCELVFAYRIRQTLAQEHHVIQPFDQDDWARTYAAYDAAAALAVHSAVRNWNLALIRSATPSALAKKLTHPERGEMPLRALLETMGGHDLNHIGQIEAIAYTDRLM